MDGQTCMDKWTNGWIEKFTKGRIGGKTDSHFDVKWTDRRNRRIMG